MARALLAACSPFGVSASLIVFPTPAFGVAIGAGLLLCGGLPVCDWPTAAYLGQCSWYSGAGLSSLVFQRFGTGSHLFSYAAAAVWERILLSALWIGSCLNPHAASAVWVRPHLCYEDRHTVWFSSWPFVEYFSFGSVLTLRTITRRKSPPWHRRRRRFRHKARQRCRAGRGTPLDIVILNAHHGSMAPQAKKSDGKGKKPGNSDGQKSSVEFGLPPAVMTALQGITARATSDLWRAPTGDPGDGSAEQQAQRKANAVRTLSKRISGDMRAKEELVEALNAWLLQLSQHLQGLVNRVRALGAKLDEDLTSACQEMRVTAEAQSSLSTSDQVNQALGALGAIWPAAQEMEVLRLAAGLRAVGTVVAPTAGLPTTSPVFVAASPAGGARLPAATGTVTTTSASGSVQAISTAVPVATHPSNMPAWMSETYAPTEATTHPGSIMAAPPRRWKRPPKATEGRPSKSPRRDVNLSGDGPWKSSTTGRTPEGFRRRPATTVDEDNEDELIPASAWDEPSSGFSWFTGWLYIIRFTIEQGGTPIGELAVNAEQEAMLPLPHADDLAEDAVQTAQAMWSRLQQIVESGVESDTYATLEQMHELLVKLRQCPAVLPHLPQGLLVAVQTSLSGITDPFSYAPSTAQEWLYPGVLLDRGGPFTGYIPSQASPEPHLQALLQQPHPMLAQATPNPVSPDAVTDLDAE